MKKSVGLPIIVLAIIIAGLVVFGLYKHAFQTPANPGAKDIPAKKAGDNIPIEQRPGGPKAPGMMKR